ncbi:hypothetical protein [Serratia aquatilis]|uniref:Uncharacterized protein n=1 Tax=Serratia aquatilis TaxID=1737515 RepID=A0ABV6EHJ3_9GAMM
MKRLYATGNKEIADTLVLLSDEMLLFICTYALYSHQPPSKSAKTSPS